ncbi:hypothetical protein [Candidatus Cyanaurora vandensis]|nr:hypothetical protein [Candidatus Cyanaurora vandensis]
MANITLEIPAEIFSTAKHSPDEFVQDLRLVALIYLYRCSEIF